jgi:hypothetical protein
MFTIPILQERKIQTSPVPNYPNKDSTSDPSSSRTTATGLGTLTSLSGLLFFFFLADPPGPLLADSFLLRGITIFPVGGKRGLAKRCFCGNCSSSRRMFPSPSFSRRKGRTREISKSIVSVVMGSQVGGSGHCTSEWSAVPSPLGLITARTRPCRSRSGTYH